VLERHRSSGWTSQVRMVRSAIVAAILALSCRSALAQGPLNSPSQILQQYQSQEVAWFAAVQGSATKLFTLLAAIEVAWTLTLVVLERSDFQSLASTLIRKIMWIGIFYALLINGQNWIPWIIQSFGILGQRAAGVRGSIAPSNVLSMGLNIFGSLLSGASNAGFLTNFGTAVSLVFAAFVTLVAYVIITIQFVAAMVESYIVIAAGFIFLGFGGSRWTTPYVERYIGLAISIGIKLMTLYLLIGVGMNLSNGWLAAAGQVATSQMPAMSAGDIAAACVIFMALCWMSPKLISGVIGGSPAFTGGDVLSPSMTVAGVGMTGAAWALAGTGAAYTAGKAVRDWAGSGFTKMLGSGTGGGAAAPNASSSAAALGATIARGSTFNAANALTFQPPPPKAPPSSSGATGSGGGQVPPPSSTSSLGQRGAHALRSLRNDLNNVRLPHDGHHHGPPPGFGGGHGGGEDV
jgi:type IV secretion system protein TrbL